MGTNSLTLINEIHHRKMVNLIYRTMLGREADPEGLATFCKELQDCKSASTIIKYVQASNEFKNRKASSFRIVRTANIGDTGGLGSHGKQIFSVLQSELSKKKENT